MDALRDVPQKSGSNLLVGWVLLEVDRNEELLGLGIDIADINTTFMCEENPVTLDRDDESARYDIKATLR